MENHASETLLSGYMKTVEVDCCQRVYSFMIVPIQEGGYVNFYGRDITIRKQTESALRESEDTYKTAFQTIPDIVILSTLDGMIIDANLGFLNLSGYTREEAIGLSVQQMNFYVNIEDRNKLLEALTTQGKIENLELSLRRKDGLIRTGMLSASIIHIKNKEHILSITKDITERKQLEQELLQSKSKAEEASRLKSSLLLNMSHELRTPLNGILGFAGILRESLSDEEQQKMADIISQSGHRLMTTLNSIMELAQVEADHTHMELEIMNVSQAVSRCTEKWRSVFVRKKIQLVESIEKEIYATLDNRLFESIVYHLIDNALKYTDSGSVSITVFKETTVQGRKAALEVKDTGIGISEKQLDYIFDAFRQGDEGIGRSHEGTEKKQKYSSQSESESRRGDPWYLWYPATVT